LRWDTEKLSVFRPPDSQCALLRQPSDIDLQGEWIDSNSLSFDVCFIDPDDDDFDVKSSLQHRTSDGVIQDWFVEGEWFNDGKILQGTWFTDLSAGAVLFYLRNNGNVDYFWWTGLVFERGLTYIDFLQLGDVTLHGRGTFLGPRSSILFGDCVKYEVLKTFVITNLPRDDDDNYYYFVETQYLDDNDFLYLRVDSAGSLVASVMLVVACLMALI
jgi:hypothetical protein